MAARRDESRHTSTARRFRRVYHHARRLLRIVRRTFIAGLVVLTPFIITFLVLRFAFTFLDGLIQPEVSELTGRKFPGLGLLALLLLTFIVGLVSYNLLGKRFFWAIETTILRLPLVGPVFGVSQRLVDSFGGATDTGFSRVVQVEYPREGFWAIGFLTGVTEQDGVAMGIVYIPTAPTPNSGWLAILSLDKVYDVDMTVNQAVEYALSGGVVAPSEIRRWKVMEDPTDPAQKDVLRRKDPMRQPPRRPPNGRPGAR